MTHVVKWLSVAISFALTACTGAENDVFDVTDDTCVVCNSEADTKAGTRLSPVYFNGEDGSRMRFGYLWKDNRMNDEPCTYTLLPNGETRCLPLHDSTVAYLDDACATPVYEMTYYCNAPKKYVRIDDFDPTTAYGICPGTPVGSKLWAVQEEINKPAVVWHKPPTGECVTWDVPDPYVRYFNLKPAQPIEEYALGTPEVSVN